MMILAVKHEQFDFTALGTAISAKVLIAKGIDTSMLRKGKVVVRLENGALSAGQIASFDVIAAWPSADLPLQCFENTDRSAVGPVLINSTTTQNTITVDTTERDLGPAVDIYLTATQSTAATPLAFTVSVGILGWEH